MVNFTIDQIRKMMDKKDNIRNISVIAHVDHGKTTLTDSLIAKAGIIANAKAGEARLMDTRKDEQARSITIKSTSVSLYYERDEYKDDKIVKIPYLINLIDSPGHVDFSSEVTAALRVTDGALVVVDCIEGVCVQTETVLRQSISERIKPILFLNKLDRIFLELSPSLEECYINFRNSIESVNVVLSTYKDDKLGNIECTPINGKVGFGSGLHAWGFTIDTFALMYSSKFSLSKKKMMDKLWGENYYDSKTYEWYNKNNNSKLLRGFNQFILKPIKTLFDAVMNNKKHIYEPIINALRLKLPKNDLQNVKKQKDLLKLIMRTWLPAGDALLGMIAEHLPSPAIAQQYRIDKLYSGPLDSEEANAIRNCDPNGPMSMYVSKMIPTNEKGKFIGFGRVFSGTVKCGQECYIMGSEYKYGKKEDLYIKKIQRTVLMMGKNIEKISECPSGNVCGLVGIDKYLLKSGTITNSNKCYPFNTMKFSVAAVVQIAVEPKNASDLPQLVEGLKRLTKSDQLVKCTNAKNGQYIIHGAGELHLEICLKDLREEYMKGAPIKVSEPIVSFAETITAKTGFDGKHPKICVSKSPNKHNRLYMCAEPLKLDFINAIENGKISATLNSNKKEFAKELSNNYNWNKNDANKIWCFGCPPDSLTNVVVDMTKGVQYLNDIKYHIIGEFMEVTEHGILCDEIMRGIRYNIIDAKIHRDPPHRGPGQIMPCSKKAFYACQIGSKPRLLEPMYIVDITVPNSAKNGVFNTLNKKRGEINDILNRISTPLTQIKAYLPVSESFGFTKLLRKNTGGQAFPQMTFSHWKIIDSDPFSNDTFAYKILMNTRKRKGLKLELPKFNDYYDKIN